MINGYLPKDKQQTNPTGRKGQGKKAAKGKGGDDSAVNEANSNVNNAVVEAIAAAAQDHKAYVNGYLNQLDAAGLPKAHRAKVAKVMLAMLDDFDRHGIIAGNELPEGPLLRSQIGCQEPA